MKARIKDKKEIAKGTLMITLDLLGEQLEFKAGQYFFLTLPHLIYPDERGARRHFSIVSSPNAKGVLVMTTRLSDNGFKKTLKELPQGSEVEVGPIVGSFTLPQNFDQPLVFIAGGIGITPFMSMLKYTAEEKLPFNITLIYSNRNQDSSAFLKELEELTKRIPNLKLVLTMTEDDFWQGEKRRINGQLITDYTANLKNPFFYIVGPPAMVEAVLGELHKIDVRDQNIKIEKFTGY